MAPHLPWPVHSVTHPAPSIGRDWFPVGVEDADFDVLCQSSGVPGKRVMVCGTTEKVVSCPPGCDLLT
ncbi:hypothetical protein DNTS_004703 [Danionella cerebrum]|uniref:Uncharacterized protein n=1 Tax=Danionella cerebrum TaxID=2873325 RepID=A0A553QYN7_9TELE|nr:hypothetical protein DNTS_004703 [Danionella translucida]